MRDALSEATDDEVRAGTRWARWSAWWKERERELAVAAKIVTLAAGIIGTVEALWLKHGRDVGRAELPVGGSERMAADRVERLPSGGK